MWPPEALSVFMQPIRTNNDAEGWHNRLNSKGKSAALHFYKLVDLLHTESEFVEVEAAFLKQNQTTRSTRLNQEVIQAQLFSLWESYDKNRYVGLHLTQEGDKPVQKNLPIIDEEELNNILKV